MGNGTGGFSGNSEISEETDPKSIVIGDFNRVGILDIATANGGDHDDLEGVRHPSLSIRLADGDGGFAEKSKINVETVPNSLCIGDFNGDGKQDLATANENNSVSIRMGLSEGKNTWLGITTDWNSPSNWSLILVPTACSQVIINTGVPNMPTLSGVNNTCYTLSLQNGATVNMGPGAKLNITGK